MAHSHVHRQAKGVIILSIAGNLGLAVVKATAGFFGNSYALIADAIESTGDVLSSILVLVGLRYSQRPADENHPYGHGRIEPLMTFIVVAFLGASALFIGHQSIQNILTPHEGPKPYTLIVLAGVILIKEVFYRFVSRVGKETNSTSVQADAWHHRSDAITSLAAFIGISMAIWLGEGYEAADDWAALLACIIILYNSYLIFRPALSEIMDEDVYTEIVKDIRTIATTVPGVIDTEKCYVRKLGLKYHVDLHLTVDGNITVKEGHDIAHRLKDTLIEHIPEIADVLIHVEPDSIAG
ncbi:MAG TPA: cation diffusion facilitator family transporter [Flavobacteriales bacterium]